MLDAVSVTELYHENTKLSWTDEEHFSWIAFVGSSTGFQEVLSRPFKTYRGKPTVALPTPVDGLPVSKLSFEEVTYQRRSVRSFAGSIPLAHLAKILFFGYGITCGMRFPGSSNTIYLRPSPSGGALYPLEIYVSAFSIDGLSPGLYHYSPPRNVLELLRPGCLRQWVADVTFSEEIVGGSAGMIFLTGVLARSRIKYGERGYRYVLLEAGHVAQNMMLATTSLRLGSVAIGGFVDDEVHRTLGVDGLDEVVLYLICFGNPTT